MIESVQISGNAKKSEYNTIHIAQPSLDSGSITVICGKNHSGKSYVLRRIHRAVIQRNQNLSENKGKSFTRVPTDDVICYFSLSSEDQYSSILVTRIANISDLIKGVSSVSDTNHKKRRYFTERSDNFDRIQIKEGLEAFFLECMLYHHKLIKKSLNADKWNNPGETGYRTDILSKFPIDKITETPRENELVQLFEKLTQGKLYFGITTPTNNLPIFELYLAFTGSIVIPIGGWSEGQKVLLSLLLLIHYKQPSIFLFDEIENHLHPEYISAVLEFIKKKVKQTIITTHHPHIIFSRFIDIANYLEFEKSSNDLPNILDYKKTQRLKTPPRVNELLEKNYSKLLTAYKLFDSYDNQLLRISSSNISNLNELLTNTFTSLFIYEVIPANRLKKPDLQSQKLYDIFKKQMEKGKINVLEFGAGDGRLLIDINKILSVSEKKSIHWTLYEPFEDSRNKINKTLREYRYRDLISVPETLPNQKFDFIIIANVLHELTPNSIAEILSYCQSAIENTGSILLVELFPLLKPEKYAVPLSSSEWTKLARNIGFNAISESIVFKNASHEAYFVQLSIKKGIESKVSEIEKIIANFWLNDILENRSGDYSGRMRLGDSDEIPKTFGELATIASIISFEKGYWT